MKLEDINPFIRYGALHTYYQKTNKNYICYDCRLFYFEEGSGVLIIGNESYDISAGMIIYLPPKTHYHFVFDNDKEIKFYTINYDLTNEFSNVSETIGVSPENKYDESKLIKYLLPTEFSKPIIQGKRQEIDKKVKNCIEIYRQKKAYFIPFSSAQLKQILFEILKEEQPVDKENKKVMEIIAYVYSNYADIYLTNADIAHRFHYHPVYVNRLFKEHTNETLHQFLINYRLENAKELLLNSGLDITAISEQVGFASYAHFIKVFREKFGMPPKVYRKKHQYTGV